MNINQAGLELIKDFEGLKLKAYLCPAGVPTIGYGHTRTVTHDDVKNGKTITKAEAERLLAEDLIEFTFGVYGMLKRQANENELSAMVSLAYNIGLAGFKRSSVLRAFNAGDPNAAARAFALWNKSKGKVLPGLTRRRAAEAALFLKPVGYAITESDPPAMPQQVDEERPMAKSQIVRASTVSGVAGTLALAAEASQSIGTIRESLGEWVVPALLVVGIAAAAYTAWERVKQRREGWA